MGQWEALFRGGHIHGKKQFVCKFVQKPKTEVRVPQDGAAAAVSAQIGIQVRVACDQVYIYYNPTDNSRVIAPQVGFV